jgi:AcrR family transcriptional regulator
MSLISDRREQQRTALILAAENRIESDGLAGLKARDLAQEIGVSLGAVYNLVSDLDELILLVSSRTLRRLGVALSEATRYPQTVSSRHEAAARLVAIALAYRRFASAHFNLWRTLFEHRMPVESTMPDWAVDDQLRLFSHLDAPLRVLTPSAGDEQRRLTGLTLFGAVHGVITLSFDRKLVGVPEPLLDQQLEALVHLAVAGMQ